jgi:chaperone BCS1
MAGFDNQFLNGGLILMLTGAAMGLLRKVPDTAYHWVKRRFSVSLTITDRDPLFGWTKLWLDSLPYSRRARNIQCSLHKESDEDDFSTDSQAIFAPAYGNHFFRHSGRFIWLERNKPDKNDVPGMGSVRPPEMLTLTVLGSHQSAARELVQEIMESARQLEQRSVRGYISGWGYWRRLITFKPRKLETVDLPAEDEKQITEAIRDFLGARVYYTQRGIPYHLNFLFAGLPGTGKTSLVSALCGHFGLHLHILNIAGPGMNDDRLVDLMLTLPRRSLLLLEDVDAVVPERTTRPRPIKKDEKEEQQGITLSALLNCMDGLTAPDGAVIVMTTNHPERLDEALLRAGRVDVRVNFGAATREQIERMCQRLNPSAKLNGEVDAMLAKQFTTAQAQAALRQIR